MSEKKKDEKPRSNGNFTVIGREQDGTLICRDDVTGEVYNCGENLEEFGETNLTPEERTTLGLEK